MLRGILFTEKNNRPIYTITLLSVNIISCAYTWSLNGNKHNFVRGEECARQPTVFHIINKMEN